MSILVNRENRVLVQGLTGREGRFHAEQMMAYGTRIVAGVTPGKGGQNVLGVPVFNSCAEAVAETGADTSVIFVPAMAAADSACEAAAAGIKLVILITEHIPVLDMVRVRAFFLHTDSSCDFGFYDHKGLSRVAERLAADHPEDADLAPGMNTDDQFIYRADLASGALGGAFRGTQGEVCGA